MSAHGRSADEIEAWLIERLRAYLTAISASAEGDGSASAAAAGAMGEIDPHLPFSYYGLDSLDAVALATELEEWLGEPVAPDVAWDYPTVHAVAAFLAEDEDDPDGVGVAAGEADEAAQVAEAVLAELDEAESR